MLLTLSQPQVPNGFSPDLVISPVHQKDAGFYICRVNCGDSVEFSQWAQVDVLNAPVSYGSRMQMASPARLAYCCCVCQPPAGMRFQTGYG